MIYPFPPPLTGLQWRPITSENLVAVKTLADVCQQTDGGLAFLNKPDYLHERYFPDTAGLALGAWAADESLAACLALHGQTLTHDAPLTLAGQVRPDWRQRGIGRYLLQWGVAQAGALPVAAGRRLQIRTETLTEAARQLFQEFGFAAAMEELVMHYDLNQPLPKCPLPAELKVVNWRSDRAEQFFQAYHNSFRERPGFPGWSAAEWIAAQESDDTLRSDWSLLALLADRPVAFLTACDEQPDGFVMQLGVIPERRRRGLASALLVTSMQRMQATGAAAAQLTVNVNNPGAVVVYRQLGFVEAGRRARFERLVTPAE